MENFKIIPFLFTLVCYSKSELKGKFIILGDVHLDPSYPLVGESCNIELDRNILEKQPFGHYECDSSFDLMEGAFKKVNDLKDGADFAIFSGDTIEHVRAKSALNESKALEILRNCSRIIRDSIDISLPIMPIFGNHDYYPKSQIPPNIDDPFMKQVADSWRENFGFSTSEYETFKKGGYYSRLLHSKLLVLVLNTNLYRGSNRQTDPTIHLDPADQFAWMRQQMDTARNSGHMVLMLIHVPPGIAERYNFPEMKNEYNEKLNDVILGYDDIIIGILSAHTHTDTFRIYYKDGRPAVPLLSIPAVTPWRGGLPGKPARNPGIRVITLATSGVMKIADYIQYYAVLENANKYKEIEWVIEYQFTKDYNMPDITAESLHNLTHTFESNNSTNFKNYFVWNIVKITEAKDRPDIDYGCDCKCKAIHICAIKNVYNVRYTECLDGANKICEQEEVNMKKESDEKMKKEAESAGFAIRQRSFGLAITILALYVYYIIRI